MASSSDHPGFAIGPAVTWPWPTYLQDVLSSVSTQIDTTAVARAALANIVPQLPDLTPQLPDLTPQLADLAPQLPDLTPQLADLAPQLPDLAQLIPSVSGAAAFAPLQDQLADILSSAAVQLPPSATAAAAETASRALGFTALDVAPVLAWETLPTINFGWVNDLVADLPPLSTFAGRAATDLLAGSAFQSLADTFAATMKNSMPDLPALTAAASTASTIQLDSWRYTDVLQWAAAFPLPPRDNPLSTPDPSPAPDAPTDEDGGSPTELTAHLSAVSLALVGTAGWLKAAAHTLGRGKATADKAVDSFNENYDRYMTAVKNLLVLAAVITYLVNQISDGL